MEVIGLFYLSYTDCYQSDASRFFFQS